MTDTINWEVITQAYALLGYQFTPPKAPDLLGMSDDIQVMMWQVFLHDYLRCQRECAHKGGGPCVTEGCPRTMLHKASATALPIKGLDASLKHVAQILRDS